MDSLSEEPTERKYVKIPESVKDYREMMRQITKRPIKLICILTAHWRPDWYYQMYSELKYERDRSKHAMIINYWLKSCRAK